MTRSEILEAADQCVSVDRNSTYGAPEDSFSSIAAYWQVYLTQRAEGEINALDVAMMMALMKVARATANPQHTDSFIDGAGYLACGGEIAG